jgi:hypothetical protein
MFETALGIIQKDARTKDAPLYVIVDAAEPSPDLTQYEGIEQRLSVDDVRVGKIGPILAEKVFAESASAFQEEEGVIVLKAASALAHVVPSNTAYNLLVLEPALVTALKGYGDEVSAASIDALQSFGTVLAAVPLGQILTDEEVAQHLKVAACGALAAILEREDGPAPEEVVEALGGLLAGDVQVLREAAAHALAAAGLEPGAMQSLIVAEGLGE